MARFIVAHLALLPLKVLVQVLGILLGWRVGLGVFVPPDEPVRRKVDCALDQYHVFGWGAYCCRTRIIVNCGKDVLACSKHRRSSGTVLGDRC